MPADTKPIDLAGLRVLLAKMTPPPWRQLGESIVNTAHITRDVWVIPRTDGDLPGICALVNAAPHLIARIAELEEAGGKLLADNLDKAERLAADRKRIAELEAGLREACEIALLAIAANEILPSTNSEAIERIHASLLPPEAPRAGKAAK